MVNGFGADRFLSASKGNYGLRLFESHLRRKPDGVSIFQLSEYQLRNLDLGKNI